MDVLVSQCVFLEKKMLKHGKILSGKIYENLQIT